MTVDNPASEASPALPATRTSGQRGFTLIELLLTVAIVGILSAVAIPSYREYVLRGARADAQSSLMEASQYLERVYSECNSYVLRDASTTPPCTTAVTGLPAALQKSPREGRKRYDVTASTLAAQNYVLTAAPVEADVCGSFTVASTGVKGLTGNTWAVADCWRR